ncbi:uncharacterized protein LOC133779062 [Humulus lupulus]|uniref:uncharacterized protein LOC133779062 n=1 Tax=Humulus lupulus TaxID=3486 RepID=UPI002B4150AB|nr:uncharacterized protein LOC133779062 [Humulus lupulus]
MVKLGARWRVGSASTIDVLEQSWLPDMENPYISKVVNSHEELSSWYWSKELFGGYSVKSAYKLLQVLNGRWSMGDNSGFWRKVWNLKIPQKVKNFLWTSLSNCLPTLAMLQRNNEVMGVLFWFEALCNSSTVDIIRVVAKICWAVWRALNDLVWNNKSLVVEVVVHCTLTYLEQWDRAQDKGSEGPSVSGVLLGYVEHWTKPGINIVKVNYDATIFASENKFGFRWIARDHGGN